jgi:hypothetical protein
MMLCVRAFSAPALLTALLATSVALPRAKAAEIPATQKVGPLGDLSEYLGIARDTQKIVKSGDFKAARQRIRDLEKTWDANEDKHRPLNPEAWTQADTQMDRAIDKLRQQKPDAAVVGGALDDLIKTLESYDSKAK